MERYKTFETERLFVKPTSEVDAAFIYELFNSPKQLINIGDRNITSIDMDKDYILNKIQSQLERLGYSNYTLLRKTDNLKIGCCGLYDREGLEGIDMGFAFLPEQESKGYAFEAADKITKIAFNEFGLHSISAITSKHNISGKTWFDIGRNNQAS